MANDIAGWAAGIAGSKGQAPPFSLGDKLGATGAQVRLVYMFTGEVEWQADVDRSLHASRLEFPGKAVEVADTGYYELQKRFQIMGRWDRWSGVGTPMWAEKGDTLTVDPFTVGEVL